MPEQIPNKKFLEYEKDFAALCSQCANQQRVNFQTDPSWPDTPEAAGREFIDYLYGWVRLHAGNPEAQSRRPNEEAIADSRKREICEIVDAHKREHFLPEHVIDEFIKVVKEDWENRYNPTEYN